MTHHPVFDNTGAVAGKAALTQQMERYADDFSALAAEVRLLRQSRPPGSPEREMASRLQGAFDEIVQTLSTFGFLIIDQAGRITHATRQAARLFELPVDGLCGRPLSDLMRLPGPQCLATELRALLAGMSGRVEKLPVQALRGPRAQLLLHALQTDYPVPGAIFCLFRPPAGTDPQRPVQQMLLADVFAGTADAWMVADHARRIVSVNTGFTAVTGYEAHEVIGRTPKIIGSGRHGAAFYEQMWDTIDAGGEWQGEICNRRRNGELYEEWLHISAYLDGAGRTCGYVALFYDLVFARKAYERIDYLVHTDALTRLPNRALFLDRLAQAVQCARSEGRPFGVLTLDIDRFKEINDTLGHDAGDRVLQVVAGHLQRIADERMLVARLGGDEFVVMAEDGAICVLETIAADLRAMLAVPVMHGERELNVTVSAGVSYFPGHGEDGSTLLRNAEIALDMAKQAGGNTMQIYDNEFSRQRMERFSLSRALRRALDKNELYLAYQPQVDAATRAITGVEALLRWRQAEQGEIPPVRFIPIAEETGLIVPIGAWVLEQACLQQVAWRAQGLRPLRMAVNIAGRQLREPGFAAMVAATVARTGIDPHWLEVEVTESELMGEIDNVVAVLAELRAMGIGIAVDDFGTGHSSLGRLHALSVDRLKVDRSFVLAMGEGEKGAAIPRAILALSASLGLDSVAEGVETEAQAAQLQEWGCGEMQGYLFSRPVSATRVAELLQ